MARRKPSKPVHFSDVVPIWTKKNVDANEVLVQATFYGLGIDGYRSYWSKLWIAIIPCILLGLVIGAATHGLGGLILGAILGFATPAAVIALFVTAVHFAIYLGTVLLVWSAILMAAWWFLAALAGR